MKQKLYSVSFRCSDKVKQTCRRSKNVVQNVNWKAVIMKRGNQVDVRYSVRILFYLHTFDFTLLYYNCTKTLLYNPPETCSGNKEKLSSSEISNGPPLLEHSPYLYWTALYWLLPSTTEKRSTSNYFWKEQWSTSLIYQNITTACTIGDTLLLLMDLNLHQAHVYKTEITVGSGLEDVEVHPPFVHYLLLFIHSGPCRCLYKKYTQSLSSCHQPGASSRSPDPTARLCCLTRSPPRTPAAPAAAPSPSLLTRLDVKRHRKVISKAIIFSATS